jgi:hypothetical protein
MNRPIALALFTAALLGSVLWAGTASAQQKSFKDQIAGAWILVSTDNTAPDGSKHQIWGANPKGMLILDASGRFSQIIVRSDRPKFKANNRMQGSPEENAAAVQGTTATFGSWSVNEADKTLTVRNEGSMFPNQVGTESKRPISVSEDELKVTNPSTASGLRSEQRLEARQVGGGRAHVPPLRIEAAGLPNQTVFDHLRIKLRRPTP